MDFLVGEFLGTPLWMWGGFLGLVVALLVLDLGVLHRHEHEISVRESLWTSAAYITLGLGFGGVVWWLLGPVAAKNYLTGFVVEKSLAMDNVFVIAMIFSYFAIPRLYQHRVLFWGILGVIVLRGLMIAAGAAIIAQAHWVMYIFAAFLIATGVKMWLTADQDYSVGDSKLLAWLRRHIRVTDTLHGNHFTVKLPDPATGRRVTYATPLLLALVMVEFVDLVFAVDSIPAVFAITTDPFIVYTSNIFAILGLRALYFALAAMVHRFHYLKYALSVLLVFIGAKVFAGPLLGFAVSKFPPALSLAVTVAILAAGVGWSLWKTRAPQPAT